MSLLEAVLLGILQGLTEFLPVSSTAHLTLAGKMLGLVDRGNPQAWTAFIAVMQLGTLAAVLVYFFRDLREMVVSSAADLRGLSTGKTSWSSLRPATRMAAVVLAGTVPVVLVGYFLHEQIEGVFTKSTLVIATSLIVLAVLLWLAERVARHERTLDGVTLGDAIAVGCAQALALIPGASRSGTTLTAGLFMGLSREAAARFSFLLSVPAVLLSGAYQVLKIRPDAFEYGVANLAVATVVSGVAGYAAIAWLLRYLMRNTTMVFVWYRIALGILLLALLQAGLMEF